MDKFINAHHAVILFGLIYILVIEAAFSILLFYIFRSECNLSRNRGKTRWQVFKEFFL